MRALAKISVSVIVGRSFWIMFGPLLLSASGMIIVLNPGAGWRTGADITFLVSLVGMMVGRWLEHCGGEPLTSTGEPSSPAHFRRYVAFTLVGGLAVWVLINLISNYMLA